MVANFDSDEVESDGDSGAETDDSDRELQIAFEKGLIKPGLYEVQEKKRDPVNNPEGLKAALEAFEMNKKLDWAERLDVTCAPVPDVTGISGGADPTAANHDPSDNVHNDFQREMTILRQAQGAWLEALPKLRALGIPTKRPDDYFAQMVKADSHMKKVRSKILSKQISVDKTEKMRKLRELKKYGKKVQQEVLLKRQKEKRNLAESVKKYRKGVHDKLDFMKNDDFGGIEAEDKNKNKNKNKSKETERKPNHRRIDKNKKFGHGGQKKRGKYNTAESAADMKSGPKPKKGKIGGRMGPSKGAKGGKGNNMRMGKSKRMQNKNKKRS